MKKSIIRAIIIAIISYFPLIAFSQFNTSLLKAIEKEKFDDTEKKVLKIRENPDNKTHKELALEYGVAESTISGIIARLRWTHI